MATHDVSADRSVGNPVLSILAEGWSRFLLLVLAPAVLSVGVAQGSEQAAYCVGALGARVNSMPQLCRVFALGADDCDRLLAVTRLRIIAIMDRYRVPGNISETLAFKRGIQDAAQCTSQFSVMGDCVNKVYEELRRVPAGQLVEIYRRNPDNISRLYQDKCTPACTTIEECMK